MRSWRLVLSRFSSRSTSLGGSRPVEAQCFYEGKTVRIIVGLAPGGGFDTYARVIARHLGKHVPGNPTVVVENMTGAGSLISANHVYRWPAGRAPVCKFNGALMLGQVLGQAGVEFDTRRFEFVGAAVKEDVACGLTKASGITSVEKWMASTTPVKLGGTAPGASPDNTARILKAALGLPIQLVAGYKGTAEIRLAAEGGEVAGGCWSWESMRATWRNWARGRRRDPRVAGDEPELSRPAERPARHQPRQDRGGAPAHPDRGPEQRRLRSALRPAPRNPEGAGPDPPEGLPGNAEGSGRSSRRRKRPSSRSTP